MNSDDFPILRRHLSHDLLRNGFLYRLGVPDSFFSASDKKAREEILALSLQSLSANSPNVRYAFATWTGDESDNDGIASLVLKLHDRAKSLTNVRPTEEFPDDAEVRAWLEGIDNYLRLLETFESLPADQRRCAALSASASLRELFDYLGCLDVHSSRFWQIFSLDEK